LIDLKFEGRTFVVSKYAGFRILHSVFPLADSDPSSLFARNWFCMGEKLSLIR
jgi:hypothetical protein